MRDSWAIEIRQLPGVATISIVSRQNGDGLSAY